MNQFCSNSERDFVSLINLVFLLVGVEMLLDVVWLLGVISGDINCPTNVNLTSSGLDEMTSSDIHTVGRCNYVEVFVFVNCWSTVFAIHFSCLFTTFDTNVAPVLSVEGVHIVKMIKSRTMTWYSCKSLHLLISFTSLLILWVTLTKLLQTKFWKPPQK